MAPSQTLPGRKLILCIDGTNDSADEDRTNVWRTYDALRNDPESNQVVTYQTGVGTFNSQNFMTKTANYVSSKLDSGFATFFEDHVSKGYKWLADHYREGDHIYLFGFSRGAHTVRCIAGMVNKVGLVGRSSATDTTGFPVKDRKEGDIRDRDVSNDFVAKVYKLYCDESVKGVQKSTDLKNQCSITPNSPSIPIEFVGVWDTVASVGIVKSKHPPFATSNQIIRIFRHALALDEHRARFNEHTWEQTQPPPKESSWFNWVKSKVGFGSSAQVVEAKQSLLEGYGSRPETSVKEVWFAGCHSDVGGGSVPTFEPHSLGRITLRWMLRELNASSKHKLLFDTAKLQSFGMFEYGSNITNASAAVGPASSNGAITSALKPSGSVPTQRGEKTSQAPPEVVKGEDEDMASDVIDQLKKKPQWWILEFAWFGKNQADADGTWLDKFRWNRGQGRIVYVPEDKSAGLQGAVEKPMIHYSVRRRQEIRKQKNREDYVPRTRFYLPGRANVPIDISKPDSPDWTSAVEIVDDPVL